jgi:sugar/nucleoside kinase (ribokinase family)
MKLLFIGHSLVDKIHFDESTETKPGGIYYSVAGALQFLEQNDEIFLLTTMDGQSKELFQTSYSKVNQKYFQNVESLQEVHLILHKDRERDECYNHLTEKLSIEKIKNFNRFDGIYINMITGYDINLNDLKRIRSNYTGKIYFDVHTLARGIDSDNKRIFRKIPSSDEWLANIDFIQANESEFQTLSDKSEESSIAFEVLNKGPELIILSRGNKGLTIFYKDESNIREIDYDALPLNTINELGCGDILGSVFFYEYLRLKDVNAAAKIANAAAGFSTTYGETTDLMRLNDDVSEWYD